jgi:ABC-type sugar transport system ATPase subunit
MRLELKRLHQDLGATMVYVTHDQLEAMALADRIVVMNNGTIQQFDTPHTIYNYPVNVFVGGFVGEPPLNFLPCSVQSSNGHRHLTLSSGETIPLPRQYTQTIDASTSPELFLGIRPHLIDIAAEDSAIDGIRARVYVVEPLGESTIVTVSVGDRILKIETEAGFTRSLDEQVLLSFHPNAVLLFDAITEQALPVS